VSKAPPDIGSFAVGTFIAFQPTQAPPTFREADRVSELEAKERNTNELVIDQSA
jgi:hypothetical protein